MDDELEQLLRNLRLRRIHEILDRILEKAEKRQVSYSTFLAWLLREEYQHQQERSIEHRIKRAQLPERWSLSTFPFKQQPSVRAAAIRQLAKLGFIARSSNIVFIGPTGVGKTGLASGILLSALENGYRGLYIKAQDLFDEMYTSLADHSTRRLVNRLTRIDVLLIDELGYLNLRPEQSNIFFKLMDERYGKKSTIITTNLDYEEWYDFLGQKKMVGALLDRLRHHCHTIRIDGQSLRDPDEA
ncbi:MAG: IS21-like element helper ATPase IstB [Deltaproteobacteria bacterium]|nr:IS21-like element helper ATPase IstB [Deltaproteobacteria bacterium]